jgi:hypothetical protein
MHPLIQPAMIEHIAFGLVPATIASLRSAARHLLAIALAVTTVAAQNPAPDAGQDVEVILNLDKLSQSVKKAFHDVAVIVGDNKLPNFSKELTDLAREPRQADPQRVDGVLGGMLGEYDKLAERLPGATRGLEEVADAVDDAIGKLQAYLARRADGNRGTPEGDARDRSLAGYREQLRALGKRLESTTDEFERQNLQRLFDSSWQLYKVVQRVHGAMSETERRALARVLQFLTRLQTNLTVAATRMKVLGVSMSHERELIGHFRDVLQLVGGTQRIVGDLEKLLGEGNPFLGDIDNLVSGDIGRLVETFLDESSKALEESSKSLLKSTIVKNEPSLLTEQQRAAAMKELGVDSKRGVR